jgi:hypothetical protein
MADPPSPPRPNRRYQVICYEITDEQRNLIMDSSNDGFIAATGSINRGVLDGELSHAGPRNLQAHLALMIANDKQLLGEHAAPTPTLTQYTGVSRRRPGGAFD